MTISKCEGTYPSGQRCPERHRCWRNQAKTVPNQSWREPRIENGVCRDYWPLVDTPVSHTYTAGQHD